MIVSSGLGKPKYYQIKDNTYENVWIDNVSHVSDFFLNNLCGNMGTIYKKNGERIGRCTRIEKNTPYCKTCNLGKSDDFFKVELLNP